MVKRELLIVVGFGLAGAVAYQLSAPATGNGAPRFSLSSLLASWRDRATASASQARVETSGTLPVLPQLGELRISDVTTLTVIGEAREDIRWTMTAEASGPTEESARLVAGRVVFVPDDLGDVLAIAPSAPDGTRYTSDLTVRVPARLTIRMEDIRRGTLSGVAGVRMENLVGDVDVRNVTGEVSGTHRNGAMTITDAGAVRLTLVGSRAVLVRTRGETMVTARNGSCRVEGAQGPVHLDTTNESVVVNEPVQTVRANATSGDLTIDRPRAGLHVDTRRTRLTVTLDAAVSATLIAAERPLVLYLAAGLPVSLDAVAVDARVDAGGFGLNAEQHNGDARLLHRFGDAARVSLRNDRGEIVITPRK